MFEADRSWSRREFLKLAGRAGLVSAVPTLASATAALNPDTVCISILHTTDLHGHILPTADYNGNPNYGGLARCAAQIRRWRRQNTNSILIDVGDVYQGTDVSLRNKGELMIDLFNHLNYDAWIVGNHEFDWGMETFIDALQRSTMPVLAANMVLNGKPAGASSDSQHPFAKIQPLIVKEIAGIKLASIGVTTPGMPFWFVPEFTRGIEFQHPVEPVRRAKSQLAESEAALSQPVGELAETLRGRSRPGSPSDVERLIGAAISEALAERTVPVDGVMHGAFDDRATLVAGPKTLNDIWNLIPYENYIVTAQLSSGEIKAVMEEVFTSHEKRNLLGLEVKTQGRGIDCRIVSMTLPNGQPLERNKKYVIALNSFDSRSGGHHFMKLRALLERPAAQYVLHPVQTRDALIGYFQRHKIVHRIARANQVAFAA